MAVLLRGTNPRLQGNSKQEREEKKLTDKQDKQRKLSSMGVVFEELQKGDGKFAIKDMHLPFKIPVVMRTVALVHPKRFFRLSFFLLSI